MACRDRECFLDRGICFARERTRRPEICAPSAGTGAGGAPSLAGRSPADGAPTRPHSEHNDWRATPGSEREHPHRWLNCWGGAVALATSNASASRTLQAWALLPAHDPLVFPGPAEECRRKSLPPLPVAPSACAPSVLGVPRAGSSPGGICPQSALLAERLSWRLL